MMKNKRLTSVLMSAALLCSLCLSSVHASIISGTQYTSGGKLVNLGNLEWLSWDITIGLSRNEIESGALGLLDQGWRYATRLELSDMFRSIAGIAGQSPSNSDGTKWLWENFDNASFNAPAYTPGGNEGLSRLKYLFVGEDGECRADTSQSCIARWGAYTREDLGYVGPAGYNPVYNSYFDKSTASSGNLSDFGQTASVLVRTVQDQVSQVSAPYSISIFALALVGMVTRRRFLR